MLWQLLLEMVLRIKSIIKDEEIKMSQWIIANWEWVLLAFYTLEKAVKLSPSKKDDILFDSIIKPVFSLFGKGK